MKAPNRKRKRTIYIMVTEHEYDLIVEKMEQANVLNMSAYIRKMAIDGFVIRLDLSDVREMVRLLRISSNNVNQVAKADDEGRAHGEAQYRPAFTAYPSGADSRKRRTRINRTAYALTVI
jgi:hypothetical protein